MDEDIQEVLEELIHGFENKGLVNLANFLRQREMELKEEVKERLGNRKSTSEQIKKMLAEEFVHLLNVRFVQPYYAAKLIIEFFKEIYQEGSSHRFEYSRDKRLKLVIDKDEISGIDEIDLEIFMEKMLEVKLAAVELIKAIVEHFGLSKSVIPSDEPNLEWIKKSM